MSGPSSPPPPPQLRPADDGARPEEGPGREPAPADAQPPAGRTGWPPWLSLAGLVAGFGITIMLGSVVIAATGSSASDTPAGVNIGLTLLQNVALVAAAYLLARMQSRPAAVDFGLRPARLWRSVGLLIAVWIGFYAISAVWSLVVGVEGEQTLPEELGADGPLVNVLAVVFVITIVAPLGEELFFRGFFFGALRNWRGPWLAAVLTGLVFGLVHAGSSPVGFLVPLAALGIGLCLLYEWTGSLYPSIALHALNNCVALGVNLGWTWEIPATMVGSTASALLLAWLLGRVMGSPSRVAGPPVEQSG